MIYIAAAALDSKDYPPAGLLPAGFDRQQHPILCRHWFGIEPFRQVGAIDAGIVSDLRFRRQVSQLHERGPRVLAEFLGELGAEHLMATIIDQVLDRYLVLTDEALDATGAHAFPPASLHGVLE